MMLHTAGEPITHERLLTSFHAVSTASGRSLPGDWMHILRACTTLLQTDEDGKYIPEGARPSLAGMSFDMACSSVGAEIQTKFDSALLAPGEEVPFILESSVPSVVAGRVHRTEDILWFTDGRRL